MRIFIVLLFAVLSPVVLANDTFEQVVTKKIGELIDSELFGHYDVRNISIVSVKDHTAEWGGYDNGYGLKKVVASFVATRNESWNKNLNRDMLKTSCYALWLVCQPKGHRFEGKVEVDVAYTTQGWIILSRNFRNRSEFLLSNYLLLEGRRKEGYVTAPSDSAR